MAKKFTSQHFINFCEKFLGRPYWYGTCVYNCTLDRYNSKAKQYPSHYTSSRTSKYKSHIAAKEICADCVGMIKGYMWTNGGEGVFEAIGTGKKITNKYQSNNCPDKSANGMFSYAKSQGMDWGTIKTIPEIPGIAVRFDGHVGVYIGNGYVIEEKGFKYGCVKTKLKEGKWTHWYKLPFITYLEEEQSVSTPPTTSYKLGARLLKKGMKGEDVKELQTLLTQFEFLTDLIDGEFGPKTEEAVKAFQEKYQLEVDGKYGPKSHEVLMELVADADFDEEKEEDLPEQDSVSSNEKLLEVTGDSVRIRKGDSTKYSIITIVNKGNKLNPIFNKENNFIISKNGWYAVETAEQIGWISGNYIKEV